MRHRFERRRLRLRAEGQEVAVGPGARATVGADANDTHGRAGIGQAGRQESRGADKREDRRADANGQAQPDDGDAEDAGPASEQPHREEDVAPEVGERRETLPKRARHPFPAPPYAQDVEQVPARGMARPTLGNTQAELLEEIRLHFCAPAAQTPEPEEQAGEAGRTRLVSPHRSSTRLGRPPSVAAHGAASLQDQHHTT
jgi:hypothetical protein